MSSASEDSRDDPDYEPPKSNSDSDAVSNRKKSKVCLKKRIIFFTKKRFKLRSENLLLLPRFLEV